VSVNLFLAESPSVDVGEVEMKSVSVLEGNSVTLQTDVTETHGDELIVWRFGDEGKLIAKYDVVKSSPLLDTDEKFRDRLQLDHQTGSLTITNTRNTDSGFYTMKISSNKQTLFKRFIVTVSGESYEGFFYQLSINNSDDTIINIKCYFNVYMKLSQSLAYIYSLNTTRIFTQVI